MEIIEVIKHSVSVAIRSVGADGVERVVAVLRPEVFGDPLSGLWGLPAASLREGETPEDAVARVLREKLGLEPPQGFMAHQQRSENLGRHYAVDDCLRGFPGFWRGVAHHAARASCGSDGDDVSGLAVGGAGGVAGGGGAGFFVYAVVFGVG